MLGKQKAGRLRHRKLKIPAEHAVNERALLRAYEMRTHCATSIEF
jgi:hypothetical protein